LAFHLKEKPWTEGVREQGAEENIWTYDVKSNMRMEKVTGGWRK
jgi:hypothetical protein